MKWHLEPLEKPEELRPGAIVQHRVSGNQYQVLREGIQPVVIRYVTLTNPSEWSRVVLEEDEP